MNINVNQLFLIPTLVKTASKAFYILQWIYRDIEFHFLLHTGPFIVNLGAKATNVDRSLSFYDFKIL